MRWDPNKEPPGGNLFVLIGGWTHCFTILFSYWFSITTIKNPIVPNKKKKTEVRHQSYFSIWGSFSNRKKGRYFATPQDTPTKWLNPPKSYSPNILQGGSCTRSPGSPGGGFFLRLAGQKFTLSHFVSSMFHVLLVLSLKKEMVPSGYLT